ncbi:MAG: hypothetical protein ACK4GN_00385 [Runella sp.]
MRVLPSIQQIGIFFVATIEYQLTTYKFTFMSGKIGFYYFLLGVFGAMLAIEGCRPRKGDDVNPVTDSTAFAPCILLSERINDVLLRAYEYDTTRRLTRMLEYSGTAQNNRIVKRYTFEYTPKGVLTQWRETNLAQRDQSFIYEIDYTNRGLFDKIRAFRVFNSGPRIEDTLTFVYDDQDRISQLKSKIRPSSTWEYDADNNVKKWLIRKPSSTTDSLAAEYSTYDNKVNLYSFSRGIQLVHLLTGKAPSRRNPLTYTIGGENVEATYQYNDKGVPTQAVLKFRGPDNNLRETVFTYSLNCR